jgi:hypothetical protein
VAVIDVGEPRSGGRGEDLRRHVVCVAQDGDPGGVEGITAPDVGQQQCSTNGTADVACGVPELGCVR